MPLNIVRNDITRMQVDAIVNSTNRWLSPGGHGVDASIHMAAGPQLMRELEKLGGCAPGEAVVTKAYDLPCSYVIHTVGPKWMGGDYGEEQTLRSCYSAVLDKAVLYGLNTVAIPVISSGAYRFPDNRAFEIAVEVITERLKSIDITVFLVVFGDRMTKISGTLFSEVAEYIDAEYIEQHFEKLRRSDKPHRERTTGRRRRVYEEDAWKSELLAEQTVIPDEEMPSHSAATFGDSSEGLFDDYEIQLPPVPEASVHMESSAPIPAKRKTDDKPPITDGTQISGAAYYNAGPGGAFKAKVVKESKKLKAEDLLPDFFSSQMKQRKSSYKLDEGFGEAVIRMQDETGMKSKELCFRANITKAVLSNIKQSIPGGSKQGYHPTKSTAIAVGIAFGLNVAEMNELIAKAGYTLSHSFLSDQIIECCIVKGHYDIYEINNVLYDFDQALLGSV